MSNQKLELEIKDEAYLCELNITVEQCILYKKIYSTSWFTSGAAEGELDNRLLIVHSLCLTFPTSVQQRKKLRKCSHLVVKARLRSTIPTRSVLV